MQPKTQLTAQDLLMIVGVRRGRTKQQTAIINAVAKWLVVFAAVIGINQLHRLRDFIAQVGHESAQFAYTREIGGERARYAPWFGRGIIQLTWLANYQAFVRWLWKVFGADSHPDYSTAEHREKVAIELKVSFLTAIFFWQWKKLNQYADNGNFRRQTKVINGGYNGWDHRWELRGRASLVLLGYALEYKAYAKFQKEHGLRQTDKYDEATEIKMMELLKAAPPLGSKTTKDGTMADNKAKGFLGKMAGFLGAAGPMGAVAGGLLTALLSNFGAVDAAQAAGEAPGILTNLIGDLKEGDLKSIAAAIGAAVAGTKATMETVSPPSGDGAPVAGEIQENDPMFFKAMNIDGIQNALGRIVNLQLPESPDGKYNDFTVRMMEGGVDSIEDGILLGLDWSQEKFIEGLRKEGFMVDYDEDGRMMISGPLPKSKNAA